MLCSVTIHEGGGGVCENDCCSSLINQGYDLMASDDVKFCSCSACNHSLEQI
jgi:hypothetical protein